MNHVYVLEEETDEYDHIRHSVVGVFSSPSAVTMEKLRNFYGEDTKEVESTIVQDSGIEWVKVFYTDCGQVRLCLSYYTLDDI